MAEPLTPLDQYQPFVDEFGRVTPDWYTWLGLVAARLPVRNTKFDASTTANVVFAEIGLPDQPDTSYQVLVESSAGFGISVVSKTVTGFQLSSPTALSAVVRWALVRS